MYARLSDLPNISTGYRDVYAEGKCQRHAVAHDYIEGHPLRWQDRVDGDFFNQLFDTLQIIHQRNIAYVDLNKWENIIVGESGLPHLIDFQISVHLPRVWPLSVLLSILQRSDLYHISKHAHRFRPDLFDADHFAKRPWWIRWHRTVANPFRAMRRKLLVLLGVRKGVGRAQSERFIEEGLRPNGQGSSPIERLYQMFRSEAYQRDAANRGLDRPQAMFFDVLGRHPNRKSELQLLSKLRSSSPHDQVVWLLKSKVALVHTQGWAHNQMQDLYRAIENRLSTCEPARKSA